MHIPAIVLNITNYILIRCSQLEYNGKSTGSATLGMELAYPDDRKLEPFTPRT
jgi:hypothetical protein